MEQGNIKSIKHVLDNWGPNVIRLFCLSGHYSKPIDYSEELLQENLTKWRQVETCYYELIHADSSETNDIEEIIKQASKEFDDALESDFNTHLALSAFFKLVKETNKIAAESSIGRDDVEKITPEFERMLDILGLSIPKISQDKDLGLYNGCFVSKAGLVNVYFTDKNIYEGVTYNASVYCDDNVTTYEFSTNITPYKKDMHNLNYRMLWVGENATPLILMFTIGLFVWFVLMIILPKEWKAFLGFVTIIIILVIALLKYQVL